MAAFQPMPGLADPVLDSQRIFRAVLGAMARPGTVHAIGDAPAAPKPLWPATVAVCLSLVDLDTPLWLDAAADTGAVRDHLRFHCGCPLVDRPETASFAVIAAPGDMPPLDRFAIGDPEYPDRSATLIVQAARLTGGADRRLTGPGIRDHAHLDAAGLPGAFWAWLRDNNRLFPLGVDVVLTAPEGIAALPRTTRVEG